MTHVSEADITLLPLEGVDVVVIMLSHFGEIRRDKPEAADRIFRAVHDALQEHAPERLFLISQNRTAAAVTAAWFGLDPTKDCLGLDLVDHAAPAVLTYSRASDEFIWHNIDDDGVLQTGQVMDRSRAVALFPLNLRNVFS